MIRLTQPSVFKALATLCLLAVLTSCSIKTIYHNLDWVLAGMIEDYVTLDDNQETRLDHQIDVFLKWHQKTQLKQYANDLRNMKTRMLTTSMDEAFVDRMFSIFKSHWDALKQQLAPQMADMLLTLSDEQIQELFRTLHKENQELEEEFTDTTRAERLAKGGEKMVDNFEDWFGYLTEQQHDLLVHWPERFRPQHSERMAFRKKWQSALHDVLLSNTDKAAKRSQLMVLIENPQRYQSEAYREIFAYNSGQIKTLLLTIDPLVKPDQREHIISRLDYFITNFDELAAEEK